MDTAEPPINPVVPAAQVEAADPNDSVIAYVWIQLLMRQRVQDLSFQRTTPSFQKVFPLSNTIDVYKKQIREYKSIT